MQASGRAWLGLALIAGAIVVLAGAIVALRATHTSAGEPVTVYAAAGLRRALEPAAIAFERETGRPVQFVWGGTGTLYGQLKLAGGDAFVAADAHMPAVGVEAGVLAAPRHVALQRLAIVVPRGNPQAVGELADLTNSDLRVALADPQQAAVGRATRRAFDDAALPWPDVKVSAATVNEVVLAVQTGAADVGVAWRHVAHAWPGVDAAVKLERAEPVVVSVIVGGDDGGFADWLASDAAATHWTDAGLGRP